MTIYWALSRLYGEDTSLWHLGLSASQVSLVLCVNVNEDMVCRICKRRWWKLAISVGEPGYLVVLKLNPRNDFQVFN